MVDHDNDHDHGKICQTLVFFGNERKTMVDLVNYG
jgi:hypothetical protein